MKYINCTACALKMNPLKEWLTSDRLASECGITDLRSELCRLERYTSVSFTREGKHVSYLIDEIKKRAERELCCEECRTKDLIIDGLLAELGREEKLFLTRVQNQLFTLHFFHPVRDGCEEKLFLTRVQNQLFTLLSLLAAQ